MEERAQALPTSTSFGQYEVNEGRSGAYATALYAGFNYLGRKTCQDALRVTHLVGAEDVPYELFAVFDGHGQEGAYASGFLMDNVAIVLEHHLAKEGTSDDDVKRAFKKAFRELNKRLSDQRWDLYASGSTGTCVLVSESRIYCGWIGDSEAHVVGFDEEDKLVTESLTHNHNFDDPREVARVRERGGIVRQSLMHGGQPLGPMRVYRKGMTGPGLAVSRSFGDEAGHMCGVIAEPDVKIIPIKSQHEFIVVASDGVWDQMNAAEVADLVHRFRNRLNRVCPALVLRCAERWIDGNEGLADDISCIVAYLRDREDVDVDHDVAKLQRKSVASGLVHNED